MKRIQHNWKKRILSLGVIGCLSFQLFGLAPVSAQDLHLSETDSASWQPEAAEKFYNSTAGDLTMEELSRASLALADVPEMVDLAAIAENGHVNRLYQQEEDLNTVIFQNRDGTKTMYYFASPVKYVDENGLVQDKKNVLHTVEDANFAANYQYVNSENDITTYFPKRLDGNSGIVMTDGSLRIDMSPVHKTLKWNGLLSSLTQEQRAEVLAQPGAEKIRALDANLQAKTGMAAQILGKQDMVTTAIAALPADAEKITAVRQDAIHNDESVEYPDAFGDGVSLRYNPELDGFGGTLVLERNVGVNSFTYRIKTNGLALLEQDGEYALVDALTGEIKGTLGAIMVQDSGTSDTNTVYNHTYQVETVEEDNEYLVTMVLDEAYLNSPETVYPLAATVSLTVSYTGVDDATIYTNSQALAGGLPAIYVGTNGSNGKGRALIKFPNLFANNSVLKTQNILSATLRVRDLWGDTTQSTIEVNMMKVGWTESTVKCTPTLWNGYDTTFLDSRTVYSTNGTGRGGTGSGYWYNFNITKAVQAWKGGSYGGQNGNYGVMLRAINETLPYKAFASSNRSIVSGAEDTRPFLVINYDSQVDVDSVTLSAHSLKMNIDAVAYLSAVVCPTNATNKNVTWSVADPSIVSVQLGRVVALKAGTTTITVKSNQNGAKKDTCQVTVIFPTNGSEIAYQPSLWNGTLKLQTNCYSYALNNQDNRTLTGGIQPGMLYDGKRHLDCLDSADDLVGWIKKDADKAGFTFEKIELADYNKACSNGHYRVALVLDVGVDYHWYRQNPDGSWSHKRGTTEVVNVDASGKAIYNPETANRSYSNADYDVFVGFFEISPLVHQSGYSAAAAQLDSESFVSLPQSQRSIEQVQEGMTYEQVMECMGKADLTGQWGSFIEEYELPQNEIAHIYYGTDAIGDVVVDSVQILQR